MYIPSTVLKWPPGLIGAESQTIGSSGVTDTETSLIVAKNILSAEIIYHVQSALQVKTVGMVISKFVFVYLPIYNPSTEKKKLKLTCHLLVFRKDTNNCRRQHPQLFF